MLNYIYYRTYSFYKKKGLAFEPHTWATVVPTFITAFALYLIYYIGVVQKLFPKVQGSVIFYALAFLALNYIMDKIFEDKFSSYKKRWGKEERVTRTIKGILVAGFAVGSFVGIFIIVNELRKF